MKQVALLMMLMLSAYAALPGNVNSIKYDNNWVINYSIDKEYIHVEAVGNNKGAVGIAFGGQKMADMDVAFIYFDNGIKIEDRSQINVDKTKGIQIMEDTKRTPAGKSDYEDNGSTYDDATGNWKACFKRKLNTEDIYDNVIVDGQETQVAIAVFPKQSFGKHTSAKPLTVKLTSSSTEIDIEDKSFSSLIQLSISCLVTIFLAFF